MNFVRRTLQLALVVLGLGSAEAKATDWVYMDLGEVIVSGNPTDGYTYVPGALDFLQNLHQAGLKLALLSNIPESWGATCQQKLTTLQDFLGSRLNEEQPFDWRKFDAVVLPPFDRYRKPHQFMFLHGLHNACPDRALFIGENPDEIAVAKGLGLATYHIDEGNALPSVETIKGLIETDFSFQHPAECAFAPLYAEILLPADVGNVSGCAAIP